MARGSIVKRGRNFSIVYYVGKTQKWRSIGPSKKEAERALRDTMTRIDRSQYADLQRIGFADFCQVWLRDYAALNVRPATLSSYKSIIRNHLAPEFENRALTSLRPADVREVIARLAENRTTKTARNVLVLLSKILGDALEDGYLYTNPALRIKRPRIERVEMSFLSPAEIRSFLEHVRPKHYAFFLTACMTGMRRGELFALKWSDVNWTRTQLHVRRTVYQGKFSEPKTRTSIRAVNMAPSLVATLKRHRVSSPPSELDLIFANEAGRTIDADSFVRREFLPSLTRAGLQRIRFHDLRHSFATLLIHQGENVKYVSAQLGHASTQITVDRYGHLLPEVHNGAGERLEKTVFGNSFLSNPLAKCQLSASTT